MSENQDYWQDVLNDTQIKSRFISKNVIVLGDRHTGKRSLLDQLHESSETKYPQIDKTDVNAGKLRIKGSTSCLDYVYLNVKNLEDNDDETFAKLSISLIDHEHQKDLLNISLNENNIQDTAFIIVLDYQKPWLIMDNLNKWIGVITNKLGDIGISLQQLEDMKANVQRIVQSYKKPSDENQQENIQEEQELNQQQNFQLPSQVLENNLGVPIIVVCNNCDESENLEPSQQEFILYHLRKYNIKYGASLFYTSIKQLTNLDNLYEYILHILYKFKLKQKPETVNHESIFIPSGFDNLDIIEQSFPGIDKESHFNSKFTNPEVENNKLNSQQNYYNVTDEEFFKQLKEQEKLSGDKNLDRSSIQRTSQIGLNKAQSTTQQADRRREELNNFYNKVNQSNNQTQQPDLQKKVENELFQKISGGRSGISTGSSSTQSSLQYSKIQDLINKNKQPQKKE